MKKYILLFSAMFVCIAMAQTSTPANVEDSILDIATHPENHNVVRTSKLIPLTEKTNIFTIELNDKDFKTVQLNILEKDKNGWEIRLIGKKLNTLNFAHKPRLVFTVNNDTLGDILEGYVFENGPLKNFYLTRKLFTDLNTEGAPYILTPKYIEATFSKEDPDDEYYDENFQYSLFAPYYYINNKDEFCGKDFVSCKD